MLEKILVPDIGDYSNVEIIGIAVKVNDEISKEDELITLETDKATMEIPAPKSGTITELLVKVGDKVSKGSPILMIETKEQAKSEPKAPVNAPKPASADKPMPPKQERKESDRRIGEPDLRSYPTERRLGSDRREPNDVYAGPGVRRYARELGVDLVKVDGSGRKDRIMQRDVANFVKSSMQSAGGNSLAVGSAPEIDFSQFGEVQKQELTRIQKISGSFLHRNWVSIPHVTQFDEADISELEVFRQGQKELAEKQGLKLTPIVFLMKAVVAALKQFPKFNSSLSANSQELILKKYYNIGVAVDTPNGLVVPVIRNVDHKGLFELAAELAAVSTKAREGKLSGADMQGGCFTISSLGGIGGTAFTPIINAPEVAILGVSKSQTKPVYINNVIEPRLILPLSLSYDHRVIDGAQAVRFTSFMVNLLSDIRRLLL